MNKTITKIYLILILDIVSPVFSWAQIEPINSFEIQTEFNVLNVKISPDGSKFVVVAFPPLIYDAKTGEKIIELETPVIDGVRLSSPRSVSFTRDSKYFGCNPKSSPRKYLI